jgi:hypothetical protein
MIDSPLRHGSGSQRLESTRPFVFHLDIGDIAYGDHVLKGS